MRFLLLVVVAAAARSLDPSMVREDIPEDMELIAVTRPKIFTPSSFSWRSLNKLAASSNQHVPVYCGGCFLFAAFHVLQDRVKIARNNQGPDLMAAHQVFLNCGQEYGSCVEGGSAPHVWRWVRDFGGVPTAGCQPYLAVDGKQCSPVDICKNCMPSPSYSELKTECWAVQDEEGGHECAGDDFCATGPYPRIRVGDFGKVPHGQEAMKREILTGGPIACNVDASELLAYRSGVATDLDANETDHVIEVVGWGVTEDTNEDYWEIRNSWGEYWGDNGFGKIRRGQNDMLIETGCSWVTPAGWGIPGHDYQDYSSSSQQQYSFYDVDAVAPTARQLVAPLAVFFLVVGAGLYIRRRPATLED